MSDFAVLGAIRSYLANHLGEKSVIFGVPDCQSTDPCCFLELEEMWTHLKMGEGLGQSSIKFKTTCVHNHVGLRSNIELNDKISHLLEGQVFQLADGRTATIRSLGHARQSRQEESQKSISQIYESLVRG
jgi:hypothetical protein